MKIQRTKTPAKMITITTERLSDNSRITFTISANKTIEDLRSLLNHNLPPYLPNQFDLYSYQRGALIHFHPAEFKLNYFPVIFDQTVLLLKMDDRRKISANQEITSPNLKRKSRYSSFAQIYCSTERKERHSLNSPVTCISILKKLFRKPVITVDY